MKRSRRAATPPPPLPRDASRANEVRALRDEVGALRADLRAALARIEALERAVRNAGGLAGVRPSAAGLLYGAAPPPRYEPSPAVAAFVAAAVAAPPSAVVPLRSASPGLSGAAPSTAPSPGTSDAELYGAEEGTAVVKRPWREPRTERGCSAVAEFGTVTVGVEACGSDDAAMGARAGRDDATVDDDIFAAVSVDDPDTAVHDNDDDDDDNDAVATDSLVETDASVEDARDLEKTRPRAALDIFLRLGEVGLIEARIAAAALLRRGAGSRWPAEERFKRDYAAAANQLDLSLHANPDCVAALIGRGELARDGLGCALDEPLAVRYFERAVERGSAEARLLLAKALVRRLCSGKIAQTNVRKLALRARRLLNEATDMGEGRAAFYVGYMYECRGDPAYAAVADAFDSGFDGVLHERAALRMYERAAGMGVAEAMNTIGTFHSEGVAGLQPSFDKALDCFTRAWEGGSLKAGANAGTLFETGLGGLFPDRKSLPEAVHWYARGVNAGHASSVLHLGQMYDDGTGVPEDKSQAELCYIKAREINDEADVNEQSSDVDCEAKQSLVHLYLYQAIVEGAAREEWNAKLDELVGEAEARNRRDKLAALIASASVGADAVAFVVLNGVTFSDAKRQLLDMYPSKAVDSMLAIVSGVIQGIDEALVGQGGAVAIRETRTYAGLVELLGATQAGKLRDARRLVAVERQTARAAMLSESSNGSESMPSKGGVVSRQRLQFKRASARGGKPPKPRKIKTTARHVTARHVS